jgi:hypothetical protein
LSFRPRRPLSSAIADIPNDAPLSELQFTRALLNRIALNNNVPDGPKEIIAEFAAPTPRFPGSHYAWDTLIKDIPIKAGSWRGARRNDRRLLARIGPVYIFLKKEAPNAFIINCETFDDFGDKIPVQIDGSSFVGREIEKCLLHFSELLKLYQLKRVGGK